MLRVLRDPLVAQRFSHSLLRRRMRWLSHTVDLFVRWWFGCYVPGSAAIGAGTRLGYGGIGIVIHKDAIVGRNCIIGVGVVIGGDGVGHGVPTIGDEVQIGAGAKLLGKIQIGDCARIGANAVVLSDVPERCTAVGVPARILGR